ncbi:MAG TPA: hypothetical protein VLE49_04415 [Anaerolineales bacterium]|nr:hypothetical protein [Anaerolineales bacterium]
MVKEMPDEKKKDPLRPETFFLPPLKMLLSFFDKEKRQREKEQKDDQKQEKTVGKNVEKLIEKLSEKEKEE